MAKQIPTQPKGAEGVSAVRDAAERAQALDPERSFIVQAPAGSGKTALLVQRLLVLLARVEEPEEVVAITFTRKAAGEMRARLLETLARARSAEPPPEPHEQQVWTLARAVLARDQERDWGLPQHPARLRVYTYDAFCQALARQAPVRSGLGGGLEVGEDPMPLYEKAVRITLAELEKSGAEGDAVAVLLTHLDNNLGQLARLLQSMLATRDQWLRHVSAGWKPEALRTELETGLHRTLQEELRRLRQDLGAALSLADPDGAFPALVRHAAVHGSTPEQPHPLAGFQELPGTDPAQIALWKAVAALMLTQDGFWRKRLDKRGGFPTDKEAGDPKALKAAKQTMESLLGRMAQALDPGVLARVWRLPPSGYTDAQWGVLSALLTLLPRAASHLRQVFAATGQVDFIEPVQAALNVLEPAGGVRHPWPGQPPRHLLVDEFQDTSITQHRLLERMVETWQEGDGRTVFLVGDPMQSIYGWREAEVGLFLRARLQGLGRVALTPLTVRVNFRSRQGIVDWVNQAFPAVLAPREDVGTGAVVYSPAEAVHSPGPEAEPVRIHPLLLREDQSTEACIEEEANRVAAIALESQQEIPGGSVAVLVRARSHLSAIVPALRRAGLAFQAVNIDPLVTRPVVSDLLSLTRVLIHPADRVAWLSLLRSPCCGLLLADLLALSQGDPPPPVWTALRDPECVAQLTADGRARVGRMLPVLETALARLGPLRRRVEGAWLALGGPAVLEGAETGQAQSFLELLEQRFPGGVMPTQRELESALEGLYAGVEPASGEALQLMTVHQAKGLEFDTVILPGLERKPGKDEAGLLTWFERPMESEPPRLLLAPVGATGEDEDPVYGFLKEVRRERRYQEAGRLLYVAATRARRRLHLLGRRKIQAGVVRPPATDSALFRLHAVTDPVFQRTWKQIQSTPVENVPGSASTAPGSPPLNPPGPRLRRLAEGWTFPTLPWASDGSDRVRKAVESGGLAPEPIPFNWAGETARHVGTVVHGLLRRVGAEGLSVWDAGKLQAQEGAVRAALTQLGVPEANRDAAVEKTLRALKAALEDPRGRWVLHDHPHARTEFPLVAVLEGTPVHLVLDRTFVDDKGLRWIIDYKTSVHEGGSPEEFLDQEQERYRAQLERYARALRLLEPERPVRVGLYFPLLGGWREWTPA